MCRQRRGPDGPLLHVPQVTTSDPSPTVVEAAPRRRRETRRAGRPYRPEAVCRVRAPRDARQGSLLDDRAVPHGRRGDAASWQTAPAQGGLSGAGASRRPPRPPTFVEETQQAGRRHRPEAVCRVRAPRDARQGSLLDDRALPHGARSAPDRRQWVPAGLSSPAPFVTASNQQQTAPHRSARGGHRLPGRPQPVVASACRGGEQPAPVGTAPSPVRTRRRRPRPARGGSRAPWVAWDRLPSQSHTTRADRPPVPRPHEGRRRDRGRCARGGLRPAWAGRARSRAGCRRGRA